MMSRNVLLVAVTGALAGWLPQANAQQKHVVLSNVDGVAGQAQVGGQAAIPLTGSAQVDSAGNIIVTCQKGIPAGVGVNACSNIGSGSASITAFPVIGTNFPATLTATTAAEAVLPWSTTGADVCYGKEVVRTAWTGTGNGPAAPADWVGARAVSGPYSLVNLFASVGAGNSATFEFTLRCYSSTAVAISSNFGVGASEKKAVVTLSPPQGGGTSGSCETYLASLSPADRAHYDAYHADARGFTRVNNTFANKTTRILGEYAGKLGPNAAPVLPGQLSQTQYLALTFSLPAYTPDAVNTSKFSFNAQEAVGSVTSSPVILTISPCPGDFRPRNSSANAEHYTSNVCRTVYDSAGMSMRGAVSGAAGATGDWCNIPAGQTMYINVTKHNLYTSPSGTVPTSNCPPTAHCGVGGQLGK